MKINMKDYLEDSFEFYKITLESLDLSKEQLIKLTFEMFNQMIATAELEEINKENFLNDLLDLASCILDDRKNVQRMYRNDYKTLTAMTDYCTNIREDLLEILYKYNVKEN